MKTKLLIGIAFFVSLVGTSQDLAEVRSQYSLAQGDMEITESLNEQLAGVDSNKILSIYKGAVLTLMAKFEKKPGEKLKLFKEGKKLIESAIEADPANIEMRMIRLGVQEHAPKILGYHRDMDDDKEFILRNYQETTSKTEKEVVKKFVMQSDVFSTEERTAFE